jgi:hypothetical protein
MGEGLSGYVFKLSKLNPCPLVIPITGLSSVVLSGLLQPRLLGNILFSAGGAFQEIFFGTFDSRVIFSLLSIFPVSILLFYTVISK